MLIHLLREKTLLELMDVASRVCKWKWFSLSNMNTVLCRKMVQVKVLAIQKLKETTPPRRVPTHWPCVKMLRMQELRIHLLRVRTLPISMVKIQIQSKCMAAQLSRKSQGFDLSMAMF